MRLTLRPLGLDVLDLSIETDSPSGDDPGDSTASAVGFTLPETPPLDVTMPDWR